MGKLVVALPIVGMILSECAQVGLMTASKAAMSDGMSNLLFIFYSNALASLLLLPTSLIVYRTERPSLTFSILCWFFLLGLLGCLIQFLGHAGIYYSSPTLGTAMLNLIPAFTYIFAVTLRMEKLDWRSSTSLAKTVGTVVSIFGAFIVTLYEGPSLLNKSPLSNLSHKKLLFQQSNWVLGGLFLLVDALMASVWLIIQGVFGSAFQVSVNAWCMHRTGPVFVSMFKPLGVVISVAVGVIFSGDTLFLGRLLGAIVVIIGFYSVLWGKAKEAKVDMDDGVGRLESSTHQEPLLQNSVEGHRNYVL